MSRVSLRRTMACMFMYMYNVCTLCTRALSITNALHPLPTTAAAEEHTDMVDPQLLRESLSTLASEEGRGGRGGGGRVDRPTHLVPIRDGKQLREGGWKGWRGWLCVCTTERDNVNVRFTSEMCCRCCLLLLKVYLSIYVNIKISATSSPSPPPSPTSPPLPSPPLPSPPLPPPSLSSPPLPSLPPPSPPPSLQTLMMRVTPLPRRQRSSDHRQRRLVMIRCCVSPRQRPASSTASL